MNKKKTFRMTDIPGQHSNLKKNMHKIQHFQGILRYINYIPGHS